MNAYELAKAQQAYSAPTLEEIIKQQADRIAELEKECHWAKDQWDKDRICFKARIAELEKSTMAWYEAGKFVSPQLKELSDDEIYELWCESDNTELLPEMRNKDGSINYIILTFSQLLLDKASEK
jgi:hypothetical protein